MKCLVLGNKGMLGSELCEYLKSQNEEVLIYPKEINKSWDNLNEYIFKSDFVFFLAHYSKGHWSNNQYTFEYLHNNVVLYEKVFDYLHFIKRPFLFASNCIAHNASNLSPHGYIKRLGEFFTKFCGGISTRFFNLIGYQDNEEKYNCVSSFINQGLRFKTIHCQTDGQEERQFLHVKDCARALHEISKNFEEVKSKRDYVDVTSFQWNTIEDVIEIVAKQLKCSYSFENIEATPRKKYEPDDYILKYWKPQLCLKESIKDIISQYEKDKKI